MFTSQQIGWYLVTPWVPSQKTRLDRAANYSTTIAQRKQAMDPRMDVAVRP